MKKIFSILIVFLIVLSTAKLTFAAVDSCNPITAANHEACCVSGDDATLAANNDRCTAYEQKLGGTSATTAATDSGESAMCSSINQSNYDSCCVSADDATLNANDNRCTAYEKKLAAASTESTSSGENECYAITSANFYTCCQTGAPMDTEQQRACIQYDPSNGTPVVGSRSPTDPAINSMNAAYNAVVAQTAAQATAACSAIKFKTLLDIAIWAKCIIGAVIIPGIFTLAFVVFLWGVFKFIRSSEKTDKEEGKQFIFMGLIGLFVMVSVWGIIKIATTTFGIDTAVPMLQTDYLSTSKASK